MPTPLGLLGSRLERALLPIANPPVLTLSPEPKPSAVTCAPAPMKDSVSGLNTLTPTAAPTPTAPAASTPTISLMSEKSLADTAMLPCAYTLPGPAPDALRGSSPMKARVCRLKR